MKKYFPELTERQIEQFELFACLVREWNEKVNLISRKDIEHLEEHYIF